MDPTDRFRRRARSSRRVAECIVLTALARATALITALQIIMVEESVLDGPVKGDWREIWQVALAGLVCGFFWEMWNFGSLAHWEYSVPYVQRFEIFHMPLLGYSGYLPFGLECLAVARLLDVLWQEKPEV